MIKNRATVYHAWGFNVIPVGNDKRPVVTGSYWKGGELLPSRYFWQQWNKARQSMSQMDTMPWANATGVAGVCGVGDMTCIDFDHSAFTPVKRVLYLLGLNQRYRWVVKTPGGGYHVWVKAEGEMPTRLHLEGIGADHVEIRHFGHLTMLPGSIHPSGGTYKFVGRQPVEPPTRIYSSTILKAYSAVTIEKVRQGRDISNYTPAFTSNVQYANAAMRNEMNRLAMARSGRRNNALNECAFNLGQLVGSGELNESEVLDNLTIVATGIGLERIEIEKTIRSGVKNGREHTRGARATQGNDPASC